MSSLYDPTAAPVDHIIAVLRDRQGYAGRHADSWSRSQSPRSEQYAQRDREVVARLDQLIRAIHAGLFDQLDAEEKAVRAVEHVDYAEAAAVREIEREMAIEAGDDSEIDRLVAEDDARNERAMDDTSRRFVDLAGRTHLNYVPNDADASGSDDDLIAPWIPAQRDGEQADGERKTINVGPHLTYRELNGTACIACGMSFAVGEESVPAGTQNGFQLFVHRDCPESEA